jgi:hypothetical protein
MVELFIITFLLIGLAFAGIAIKIIVKKDGNLPVHALAQVLF